MPQTKIGKISKHLSTVLNRPDLADKDVFIGTSNILHMQSSHPKDYLLYHSYIKDILLSPDFACINPKDGSIELVKEFKIGLEYVKLAIRLSSSGTLYARSLYRLNNNRVKNFIAKGTLKKV
ncbi:MAG: hypothetical protein IJC38_04160 [Erysipelotrichaceae bacterium]|nr:hypothetical protein [Erysipelotrichaceae bacterium]